MQATVCIDCNCIILAADKRIAFYSKAACLLVLVQNEDSRTFRPSRYFHRMPFVIRTLKRRARMHKTAYRAFFQACPCAYVACVCSVRCVYVLCSIQCFSLFLNEHVYLYNREATKRLVYVRASLDEMIVAMVSIRTTGRRWGKSDILNRREHCKKIYTLNRRIPLLHVDRLRK